MGLGNKDRVDSTWCNFKRRLRCGLKPGEETKVSSLDVEVSVQTPFKFLKPRVYNLFVTGEKAGRSDLFGPGQHHNFQNMGSRKIGSESSAAGCNRIRSSLCI